MSRSDTTGAMFYFAIVGRKDNPLYESEFGQAKREMRYLNQMIAHASLDMIDEQVPYCCGYFDIDSRETIAGGYCSVLCYVRTTMRKINFLPLLCELIFSLSFALGILCFIRLESNQRSACRSLQLNSCNKYMHLRANMITEKLS